MFEVKDVLLGNRHIIQRSDLSLRFLCDLSIISSDAEIIYRNSREWMLLCDNPTVNIICLFYCLWRIFSLAWCFPDVFRFSFCVLWGFEWSWTQLTFDLMFWKDRNTGNQGTVVDMDLQRHLLVKNLLVLLIFYGNQMQVS